MGIPQHQLLMAHAHAHNPHSQQVMGLFHPIKQEMPPYLGIPGIAMQPDMKMSYHNAMAMQGHHSMQHHHQHGQYPGAIFGIQALSTGV
jgi:hypothetical protein